MKKTLALAGALGLLALACTSAAAAWGTSLSWIATETETLPGFTWADGVIDGADYLNGIPGEQIRDWPENYEFPWGPQSLQLDVPLLAHIPCVLVMRFRGNDMNIVMGNAGPGAVVTAANDFDVAFLPELNGLVKEDWSFLPGSLSPTINANPPWGLDLPYYIRACDTFQTDLWSNLAYKYNVKVNNAGKLLGPGGATLDIGMRTIVKTDANILTWAATQPTVPGDWTDWGYFALLAGADAPVIAPSVPALTESRIFHQFRVPMDVVAGEYKGTIS